MLKWRAMNATVTVTRRALERIHGGHPWVDRDEIVRGPDGAGDVVRVGDGKRILGTALWSDHSRIALRMIARGEARLDEALLDERIVAALGRRLALFGPGDGDSDGSEAFRVVHGEADLLPGLFVDRYADVAVVQTTCAGMDAREPLIAAVLERRLGVRLVVARDDGAARDFEQLPRRKGVLRGSGPSLVDYRDAGSLLRADVLTDAKTGGFLDQQENHARAAGYARAAVAAPGGGVIEALDAFTYHGGFALALARAGARILALDESAAAIDRTRENAARNQLTVDARCWNAFDALRTLEAEGRRFDVVVIDPPALAKRSSALATAERAYKELNLRALRLCRPGGLLVTCSCSGKLTADRFARVVASAARDVGRPVQIIERRGAGRDHPPLLGVPETDYLKCWMLRVLE